jgi:hypothetical protein
VLGGPDLANECDLHQSYSKIDLRNWTKEFPLGGFHVNPISKTLDFWIGSDCPNLVDKARTLWKGWTVTWHKDVYESQLALTRGTLIFNEPSPQAIADSLTKMLMVESKPVDVLGMAARMVESQGGGDFKVNPFALRDDRLPISREAKTSILSAAFSQVDISK